MTKTDLPENPETMRRLEKLHRPLARSRNGAAPRSHLHSPPEAQRPKTDHGGRFRWLLVVLVVLCLIFAAWVWIQILSVAV
jgi:ferric-dicitrate binding protein FerR (iron transport regulator)